MGKRTNEEWLADLRDADGGRDEALAELHRLVLAGLPYALGRWLSPDDPRFPALIEEVAQETCLRVLARLDSFAGRSQFTTWVHTLAIHSALTELRRAKWQEVSLDELLDGKEGEDAQRDPADGGPRVEQLAERGEALVLLRRILENDLTSRQRAAIVGLIVRGVSMDQMAALLGTDRNALYKLLHDARLKMKRALEKEGLSPGEVLADFEQV